MATTIFHHCYYLYINIAHIEILQMDHISKGQHITHNTTPEGNVNSFQLIQMATIIQKCYGYIYGKSQLKLWYSPLLAESQYRWNGSHKAQIFNDVARQMEESGISGLRYKNKMKKHENNNNS